MEYNLPSEAVKNLDFAKNATDKIMSGVNQLADAVKSTLGASGKCVIYEDAMGKPVITKDGVTVANNVILLNSVESMGANLVKEAARKTVDEAGDGTTTATVLTQAILKNCLEAMEEGWSHRTIKEQLEIGVQECVDYIDSVKQDISFDDYESIFNVAKISTNGDDKLAKVIADAYISVGKDGVVLLDESDSWETYVTSIKGLKFDSGLKHKALANSMDGETATYEDAFVFITGDKIPSIRKIQTVMAHCIANEKPLLIIGHAEQPVINAIIANKVKGGVRINIVDPAGFGPTRPDTLQDIAIMTGAKVIDESLGDSFDTVDATVLGRVKKCVTDHNSTVLTLSKDAPDPTERIEEVKKKIKEESNGFIRQKLEERLAMLAGGVASIKVGGYSPVEQSEKKDRVEDAIFAVKAAIEDGVVPGGGVILNDAKEKVHFRPLKKALSAPMDTILENAGLDYAIHEFGKGIDVSKNEVVDMFEAGIIDPAKVTKTALKNAVSVAVTILSAGCVISNRRMYEGVE